MCVQLQQAGGSRARGRPSVPLSPADYVCAPFNRCSPARHPDSPPPYALAYPAEPSQRGAHTYCIVCNNRLRPVALAIARSSSRIQQASADCSKVCGRHAVTKLSMKVARAKMRQPRRLIDLTPKKRASFRRGVERLEGLEGFTDPPRIFHFIFPPVKCKSYL